MAVKNENRRSESRLNKITQNMPPNQSISPEKKITTPSHKLHMGSSFISFQMKMDKS